MKNIIQAVKNAIQDYDDANDIDPGNDNQCSEDACWTSPVCNSGDGAAAGNIVRDVLCHMDALTAEVNDLPGAGWYRQSLVVNGRHVASSGWQMVSDADGIELFRRAVYIDRRNRSQQRQ